MYTHVYLFIHLLIVYKQMYLRYRSCSSINICTNITLYVYTHTRQFYTMLQFSIHLYSTVGCQELTPCRLSKGKNEWHFHLRSWFRQGNFRNGCNRPKSFHSKIVVRIKWLGHSPDEYDQDMDTRDEWIYLGCRRNRDGGSKS